MAMTMEERIKIRYFGVIAAAQDRALARPRAATIHRQRPNC